MDIRALKLKTSEEIVVEYVEYIPKPTDQSKGVHRVKNPIMYMSMPNGQGSFQTTPVPWMGASKGTDKDTQDEMRSRVFDIPAEMIMFSAHPMEFIREDYEQSFGVGLVKPKSDIIKPVGA